jgi:exonuclease VII small subunit
MCTDDKRAHDKEMLIDELEHRVQRLEERLNSLEYKFNMHQEGLYE